MQSQTIIGAHCFSQAMPKSHNSSEVYSIFMSSLTDLVITDQQTYLEQKFSRSNAESSFELRSPFKGMTLNVTWKKGVLDGSASVLDDSRKALCEFSYKDFTPSGVCKFYKDNHLLCTINVLNGIYYGCCEFYKGSTLIYKGDYYHGDANGSGTLYYEDGSICYQGEFKYGLANGEGVYYSKEGREFKSNNWENGVCQHVSVPIFAPSYIICPSQIVSNDSYSVESMTLRFAAGEYLVSYLL